jgi:hypothetical protein
MTWDVKKSSVWWLCQVIKYVVHILFTMHLLIESRQVKTLPPYPKEEITIPEGHCWVEGDNSMDSEDSNTFGPVRVYLLIYLLYMPICEIDSSSTNRSKNGYCSAPIFTRKLMVERLGEKIW